MSLSFFKHKTSIILLSIVNPKLPRDDENRPLMKETTKLSSPLEVGKLILMRYTLSRQSYVVKLENDFFRVFSSFQA